MDKIMRFVSVFLAAVLLFSGAAFAEEAPGTVRLISHRGYNTAAPENTLPAFELSARMGYAFVETDVCFTKDLVPVLLHDPYISRTARNADGSRPDPRIGIGSITYEEALAYDFGVLKGEEFAGTKLPTFDAFLVLCRERGVHPYIELKENGSYLPEDIAGLVDLVRGYGMERGVTWISMDMEYLEWVRDADPDARLGYVVSYWLSRGNFGSILKSVTALRTGTNEVFLDVSYRMLSAAPGGTQNCVAMCRDAGVPLEVWTVDDKEILETLDPYITGVTTNSLLPERDE